MATCHLLWEECTIFTEHKQLWKSNHSIRLASKQLYMRILFFPRESKVKFIKLISRPWRFWTNLKESIWIITPKWMLTLNWKMDLWSHCIRMSWTISMRRRFWMKAPYSLMTTLKRTASLASTGIDRRFEIITWRSTLGKSKSKHFESRSWSSFRQALKINSTR